MTRAALQALLGGLTPDTLGALGVDVDGDLGAVADWRRSWMPPDPDFDIVTP